MVGDTFDPSEEVVAIVNPGRGGLGNYHVINILSPASGVWPPSSNFSQGIATLGPLFGL